MTNFKERRESILEVFNKAKEDCNYSANSHAAAIHA